MDPYLRELLKHFYGMGYGRGYETAVRTMNDPSSPTLMPSLPPEEVIDAAFETLMTSKADILVGFAHLHLATD